MIGRTLVILGVLGWAGGVAFGGSVRTRDGRTIEGDARLTERLTVVIAAGGNSVEFPLDQVEHADLRRLPATRPSTPAEWETREINCSGGSVEQAGARVVTHDAGRGLRPGAGKGRGDSFLFVHQPLEGDGDVVARVYSEAGGRVGVMVRESLEADAPFAMVARGGRDETSLVVRRERGGDVSMEATRDVPIVGAAWVKLVRRGHWFSAFESADGKKWTLVGDAMVGMFGERPAYVGLAAAAGGRAVFDGVVVRRGAGADERSPRGVLLRSGLFVAGDAVGGDDTAFVLTHRGRRVTVPTTDVARVVLRPLTAELLAKLDAATPPGALLWSGDFIEGAFKSLDGQTLKLDSVIFGPKSFGRQGQAAAVSLARPATPRAGFILTREDGSTFHVDKGTLDVDHPLLGRVTLAPAHVVFVRRIGAKG